jgi:RNA polymerase sigma factor (sigma-70 family)
MSRREERRPDPAALAPYLEQVSGPVGAAWRRLGGRLNSDVLQDCLQEAAFQYWRVQEKLASMAEQERAAFAAVCVRRAVCRLLEREGRHQRGAVSLEALAAEEQEIPLAGEGAAEWEALFADSLLEQVSRGDLAEALRALAHEDRMVLDLFYVHGLKHRQIARRMQTSPAAVKLRCSRVLRSLRRTLTAGEAGEPEPPHPPETRK